MSEREQEKLDSGNYILVSRIRNSVQFWSIIVALLGGVVYLVRKDGLTYDSQQRKITIENTVFENKKAIEEINRDNKDVEKRILILERIAIETNNGLNDIKTGQEKIGDIQIKIGQDLQVVKNKVR